jgi:hypothetical protein
MSHVNDTIRQIKELVPQVHHTNTGPSSRSKRGIFDFVGEFSKTLFGTATTGDLNILAGHMNQLTAKTATMAKLLSQHEQQFSSFISTTDDRFNNVLHGVAKNHEIIEILARQMNVTFDSLEEAYMNMV